jgi:autotransporter-associated beta strand protein
VKSNSSQWTLAGDSTYTGGTTIQSGTLITNTNFSNGTLNLSGGTARVAQRPNNNESDHVTLVPAVQFNGGALDLTNNAMIIGTSPLDNVRQAVTNGYSGGAWNGNGINSSLAAASSTPKTAIGYAEASTLGITNFHGYIVDGSAILLAYTINGDANLDGKVNALDFNLLASAYGAGSNLWTKGDFNFDGNVDTLDFDALSLDFNQSTPPPAAPALGTLVPEPSILSGFAALALLARRRRVQKKQGF